MRLVRACVAVLAGVPLLVAGCAVDRTCAGPMIPGPDVWLDVAPWSGVHRDATIRACADQECQTASPSSYADGRLFLDYRNPEQTRQITVSVTATARGRTVLDVTAVFPTVEQTMSGPCGDVSYWQTPVTLGADGRLRAG